MVRQSGLRHIPNDKAKITNRKLGYGGTKEEMQRLLDDAEKISGIKYDISSYADVTQAIHVMQTEMGITGTTAQEAASTISGSLSMTKAAYSNFITGLADDNADMGALTDNLMGSIDALAGNVVPRLVTIMGSISNVIPAIVPRLLDAATQILGVLIDGLSAALPSLLTAIVGALTQIMDAVVQALPAVLTALVGMLPQIMTALMQLLTSIVAMLPQLIMQVLPAIVQAIVGITQAFVQALPAFIAALTDAIVQIVGYLPVFLPQLIEAAVQLFMAFVQALPQVINALVAAIPAVVDAVINMLPTLIPALLNASVQLFMAIVQAVPQILGELLGAIGNLLGQAWDAISHFDLAGAAYDMVAGMVRGISDAAGAVWDAIVNVCTGALDAIKGFFGIASPSKVMRATFRWIPEGGALGIDDEASIPVRAITDLGEEMQKAANAAVVTMPAPRIDAGALAGVSVSGAATGGLAGASAARVIRGGDINITTGETDPSKLARMISRAEQRQAYALGTI